MSMILIIVGAVVLVGCYMAYVSVIQKKNKVLEAFSSIDVQLKKRYDLIPNILTIANKFMEHEKGLFEEVTKLRTQALSLPADMDNMSKKIELDSKIKGLMHEFGNTDHSQCAPEYHSLQFRPNCIRALLQCLCRLSVGHCAVYRGYGGYVFCG